MTVFNEILEKKGGGDVCSFTTPHVNVVPMDHSEVYSVIT